MQVKKEEKERKEGREGYNNKGILKMCTNLFYLMVKLWQLHLLNSGVSLNKCLCSDFYWQYDNVFNFCSCKYFTWAFVMGKKIDFVVTFSPLN